MEPHRNFHSQLWYSNILAKDFSQEGKETLDTGTKSAYAITPAGLDALAVLRIKINKHLLLNLPDWKSLNFSAHTKPTRYARLRLSIGNYNNKDARNPTALVYAYLKPPSSSVMGPTLAVEIITTHVMDGSSTKTVVSEQAIHSTKTKPPTYL
ncbi:hypothetical protein COCC4DRAFT_130825 [Bipolaris maydis ATCC 48331]|uniref:Uncharacterized protein n=2 Tax=Cochliobolus heterostrophus TaxID=5016 RepID=M2UFU4_COCH5|nr:uncharacterized protein COCC4DRAFT_130825 [Bipolaris maydis ATCC 48331]EMD92591.1 hypothetical protein COCHEDRAFT_1030023 [Bipolaris maydis C5]ENI08287.1 hypothetical protein COCC4DRAFT_130825 [Bipolaris maydis ATCC 48331]KAJ6210368.1 hypothetical protein PSV09DRAFT_1030023 [Bipolaris maydis]